MYIQALQKNPTRGLFLRYSLLVLPPQWIIFLSVEKRTLGHPEASTLGQ